MLKRSAPVTANRYASTPITIGAKIIAALISLDPSS